jgi:hypothetical protein
LILNNINPSIGRTNTKILTMSTSIARAVIADSPRRRSPPCIQLLIMTVASRALQDSDKAISRSAGEIAKERWIVEILCHPNSSLRWSVCVEMVRKDDYVMPKWYEIPTFKI